jgi:hypothetical protein
MTQDHASDASQEPSDTVYKLHARELEALERALTQHVSADAVAMYRHAVERMVVGRATAADHKTVPDAGKHFNAIKKAFAAISDDDEKAVDAGFELLGDILRWALQQDGSIWTTQRGTAGYLVTLDQMVKDEDADQTLTALAMIRGVLAVEPVPQDTQQAIADQRARALLRTAVQEYL